MSRPSSSPSTTRWRSRSYVSPVPAGVPPITCCCSSAASLSVHRSSTSWPAPCAGSRWPDSCCWRRTACRCPSPARPCRGGSSPRSLPLFLAMLYLLHGEQVARWGRARRERTGRPSGSAPARCGDTGRRHRCDRDRAGARRADPVPTLSVTLRRQRPRHPARSRSRTRWSTCAATSAGAGHPVAVGDHPGPGPDLPAPGRADALQRLPPGRRATARSPRPDRERRHAAPGRGAAGTNRTEHSTTSASGRTSSPSGCPRPPRSPHRGRLGDWRYDVDHGLHRAPTTTSRRPA